MRLGLLFLDLGVLKKPVWQGPAHAFILNNQVLCVQLHDLLTVFSDLFNSIEYVPAQRPFNLLGSPEVNAFAVVSFGFRIVKCHFRVGPDEILNVPPIDFASHIGSRPLPGLLDLAHAADGRCCRPFQYVLLLLRLNRCNIRLAFAL